MTDKEKLDAIRAEIHRLIDVRGYDKGMANDLFAFMDSLSNEPVSEDLNEAAIVYNKKANFVCAGEIPNEHFIAGAKWQKEQALAEIQAQSMALAHGCPKETVSEDLEEAGREWLTPQLDKSYANYGEDKMMELTHFNGYAMFDAIEFGAQWQKQQDQETIELAEDHAMLAGMEKMKQQMMKDAVETSVCALLDGLNVIIEPKYLKEYRFGEKVKVIVIKED